MMKLLGSPASPYVRKVRIVMAEKRVDHQYERENVWAADTRIQDANPLGKVPALLLEDGGAVYDSRVIVEYLDTLTPVQRLIPPAGRARIEVRTWEALADGLLDAALMLRIEHTQRTPEQRSETWLARQSHKIDQALQAMSQGLADKTWCNGNHLTLADIAVGCALAYLDFRQPQIDWRERHANLATFYARIEKRPSFMETQPQ